MKNLLISLLCLICLSSSAETIEIVATTSPGGPIDTVSRKIADKLETAGINSVVINKPGAAHMIGFNYIMNSQKPTMFVAMNAVTATPLIGQATMIVELGWYSNDVYVSSNSGIKSWVDLVKLSKKRDINFGHGGIGTASYIAMSKACEKINCLPVPFKSGAEGMASILSGTIDAYALISFGSEQFSQNPQYRKISSVKSHDGDNWVMLFGKNLPPDVASDIVKVVSKMEKIK